MAGKTTDHNRCARQTEPLAFPRRGPGTSFSRQCMRGKIDRGADSSFPTLDARWHATLHLPLFHILVGKGQGPTKIKMPPPMVSVYQRCHGQNKWSSFLPASAQWMLRNVTKVTRAIVTLSVAKSCACFSMKRFFSFCMDFLTTLDSACTSGGWLKLYPTGIGSHALVR